MKCRGAYEGGVKRGRKEQREGILPKSFVAGDEANDLTLSWASHGDRAEAKKLPMIPRYVIESIAQLRFVCGDRLEP